MKTIVIDAIGTFIIEGERINRPMFDLLEKYPNRKIVVSNANDEEIAEFGLNILPYELFTLKHDPEKTNPEFFRKLLAHLKLQPEDIIYFEHNPEAVKSAQSVGIVAYHYDSDKKDLVALKLFLDESA